MYVAIITLNKKVIPWSYLVPNFPNYFKNVFAHLIHWNQDPNKLHMLHLVLFFLLTFF